jgi:hypothetical protein
MKKLTFWLLAVAVTLASAVYQRITGPTHPQRAEAVVAASTIHFDLPRSAETTADEVIRLPVPAPAEAYLEYRHYEAHEPWSRAAFVRKDGDLVGSLPKQPAAGKLAYKVYVVTDGKATSVTGDEPVVIRFKDPVPLLLLIVHVTVMFAGMLASTAAGLAALDRKRNPRRYALWALALIFLGGFLFGPLVQKYAFGVFWSGFPLGMDLTDSKTLFAFIFWVAAVIAGRKGKPARGVVLAASIATFAVYLIPHSLLGSHLKYTNAK